MIEQSFLSGRQDSNLRPLDPQPSALPGCATSRNVLPSVPITHSDFMKGKCKCNSFKFKITLPSF